MQVSVWKPAQLRALSLLIEFSALRTAMAQRGPSGTRSGWASKAQLAGPAPCPP